MCNHCRPFNGKTLDAIRGAITATVSFTADPEPRYRLEVSHWEPTDKASTHLRKVTSVQDIPVSFCPICGRDLRGGETA